jgi:hypothetical protein
MLFSKIICIVIATSWSLKSVLSSQLHSIHLSLRIPGGSLDGVQDSRELGVSTLLVLFDQDILHDPFA